MSPTFDEVLASLQRADSLPPAPPCGWEETFLLAAPMARSPETFVRELAKVNLPLAGRCALQPDVALAASVRAELAQALVTRSREPEADLRSRIAAVRVLGELGDPRYERRDGPHGPYLWPPFVSTGSIARG
jgi:4'-phosphopantetheinyl transferase EntD